MFLLGGCGEDPTAARVSAEVCSASGVVSTAAGSAACKDAVAVYASTGKFDQAAYSGRRDSGDGQARLCFNTAEDLTAGSRTCAYRCLAPARTETVTIPAARQCQPALPL